MNKGFTLVELSIVLVIIGLLIGGILVGQTLIEAAKMQSQIRQFEQYDAAISSFKTKFKQLPGDCSICNHTSNGVANPLFQGNNDGNISDLYGGSPPFYAEYEVGFLFVDLHNMGIINRPVDTSTGACANLSPVDYWFHCFGKKRAFPDAAIGRGGLIVTGNKFNTLYYAFTYANGLGTGYLGNLRAQGTFSPIEAAALDSKLDDGNPITGNIASTLSGPAASTSILPFQTDTNNAATCINNNTYNVSLTATNLCRPVIKSNVR